MTETVKTPSGSRFDGFDGFVRGCGRSQLADLFLLLEEAPLPAARGEQARASEAGKR